MEPNYPITKTIISEKRPKRRQSNVFKWKATSTILLWVFIGVGLLFMVMPGLWMILSSFKTRAEIMAVPMRLFPDQWMLVNYANAIKFTKFYQVFLNSIVITTVITIVNVFTCTWGGYTFGKLKWPGRDLVFFFLLSTMMIPGFLIIIPRYVLVAKMGMLNSYEGMIIPFLFETFGIFLAKQHMLSIPDELLDAARVDGCSAFGTYWRIILPLSKPIMAVLVIFIFNWTWDNLLWASMILTTPESWTLPVALANLKLQGANYYELQLAGASLAVLPVVIIFILFQRNIIQSVTITGLKG